MTTSDTQTGTDTNEPPSVELVIVAPMNGETFPGTPDAKIQVIVDYTGVPDYVDLEVDPVVGETMTVGCEKSGGQCTVELTLPPGSYDLTAMAVDAFGFGEGQSTPVTIEVTAESATTGGPTTDGSTGAATDGSTGAADGSSGDSDGTGDSTPDKGCACDANGRPTPGLALLLGGVALAWRRRKIA